MATLFFIGVASILYPLVSNLLSIMTANTVIYNYKEEVKKLDTSEIDELFSKAEKYNKNLFNGSSNSVDAKCLNREDNIICYVDVPKVNIYLPVYYGTTNEVLEKGCGYLENTSLPVGGENTHSVISGHTGLPSAEMFTSLDQVKEGDMFYIHILDKVLAYKISHIQAVLPDQTNELQIIPSKDIVTLLTCTPYGINDKRLLVRGTRVPYIPNEDTNDKELAKNPTSEDSLNWNVIEQMIIISAILLAAIIIFILSCVFIHFNRKESVNNKSEACTSYENREEL